MECKSENETCVFLSGQNRPYVQLFLHSLIMYEDATTWRTFFLIFLPHSRQFIDNFPKNLNPLY